MAITCCTTAFFLCRRTAVIKILEYQNKFNDVIFCGIDLGLEIHFSYRIGLHLEQ